jgi:hypothetical protein
MRNFLIVASAAFLLACTPPAPTTQVRAPAEGETLVEGVVTQVEDGAYPQFTVTIQPESGAHVALYLNAESGADLNGQAPASFAGQSVIAYYTTAEDLALTDLRTAAGVALLPADGPAPATDALTITGALSGAGAVTASDLPDVITVTDADGIARNFEYYITPEIVAANGQQVTARYQPGERHEITLLHPADATQR